MARLRRHGQNRKAQQLPEITMKWTRAQMLNDARVIAMFADGKLDTTATKKNIINVVKHG
tara:strand:- start:2100 stop:2279 length:180 start_codon:yes stop_codon:yes gene_type:complete